MKNNKKLKVLIEGTPIFRNRAGVGRYVYHVLDGLFKIDKINQYQIFGFLFIGKKFAKPYAMLPPNVSYRLVRYLPSKVVNIMPRKILPPPIDLISLTKPDVVLFTDFVRSPLITKAKSIVIVYDMSFELFGQYTDKKTRELLIKQVPKAVRQADVIITISENSKKEIVEHYKIDPNKIRIINPGIDHKFYRPQPKEAVEKVKQKFNIQGKYILYEGTLEPRKNINGILDAFSNLSNKLKDEYVLVLAGGRGWLDEDIQKRLDDLSELNIIKTGYVPDADLPALYSGASLFVYPSFYEGFGMPPLEAMACGVPVITANNSSLPEVVGDAAITIDAKDTKALSFNMSQVLTKPTLAKQMSSKGIAQANKFSWKQAAKALKETINNIAKQ